MDIRTNPATRQTLCAPILQHADHHVSVVGLSSQKLYLEIDK